MTFNNEALSRDKALPGKGADLREGNWKYLAVSYLCEVVFTKQTIMNFVSSMELYIIMFVRLFWELNNTLLVKIFNLYSIARIFYL